MARPNPGGNPIAKIDQTAQLQELPDYWQEQIRKLRSENHSLRTRLKTTQSIQRTR